MKKHDKPAKTRAKTSTPDALAMASQKASATLGEEELKKVSGGVVTEKVGSDH
jgi:hypothetical protein